MKTNARPDWDDDAEREPLRAVLRSWRAPAPPAEIEDALRIALRRRRPRPRLAVWLAAAAAVVLIAAWPLVAPPRSEKPAAAPAPPTGSARSAARTGPDAASTVRSPGPATVAHRRAASVERSQPAVVVEPHQAELLAELERGAWQRADAPEAAIPAQPTREAPAFRAEWEELAGEWPAVQVVVSKSGR